MTSKGQVTLRKELLAHLGVKPGQRLDVEWVLRRVYRFSASVRRNALTSAELKRRGIAAIEQALQHGPVHLLKRNRSAAVVLSEQHYRQLQVQASRAPGAEATALQVRLIARS